LKLSKKTKFALIGGAAGLANGFFGGGGGMILVPLLSRWTGLEEKNSFATSVAITFLLCMVSASVYLLRGGLEFPDALPYLAGGLIGGYLGGRLFRRMPALWLRRLFGLLILAAGIRSLWIGR
jgi:uncharacterized membrane protein YfcA